MRILYDHQVFSLQNTGGASRYYYELIRSLVSNHEINVEVWLGVNQTVFPFRQLPRTHVVSCGKFLGRGHQRYLANEILGNVVAAFAGQMDVYHSTLYRSMPLVRARGKVATHHDCAHERFPELFRNAREIVRAKRRLYTEADGIICISKSSQADLLRFYDVDARKTRVIYHGLHRLHPSAPAMIELQARAKKPFLLFVGARGGYKNFENLLRAFRATSLHKSMQLLALGGGVATDKEKSLTQELGLADCVRILPQVSDALLAQAYAAATLLVYPSCCEGFGYPPLEAMAAGCPTLVCNTSCLPEICGDAPFYFEPDDQSSLQRMLIEAVTNEPARKLARERGTRVAARYNWEKCAAETLALYRECQ